MQAYEYKLPDLITEEALKLKFWGHLALLLISKTQLNE
jgi:hypothetical protein